MIDENITETVEFIFIIGMGVLLYLFFLILCVFYLPFRAWNKKKRKTLALVIVFTSVGIFLFYLGYYVDIESIQKHTIALYGIIFPQLIFLIQMIIYVGYKFVNYVRHKI